VIGGIGTIMLAALWRFWFPDLAQRDQLIRSEVTRSGELQKT
jgi:hypothetical protein